MYSYLQTHQVAYIHAYTEDIYLHLFVDKPKYSYKIIIIAFYVQLNLNAVILAYKICVFTMQTSLAEICKEIIAISFQPKHVHNLAICFQFLKK